MPNGKPAAVACVQLTAELSCAIFGEPWRPGCCVGLAASEEMCGATREEALKGLTQLEAATRPER